MQTSCIAADECRRVLLYLWKEERLANSELRYVGTSPFKHLTTMVTSLMGSRPRYGHIFLFLLEYERQNFGPVAISGCSGW